MVQQASLQTISSYDIPDNHSSIYLKRKGIYQRIQPNDILYVEADGDYTIVYTEDYKCHSSSRLLEMEDKLLPEGFLKVHRSYLINPEKVEAIDKRQALLTIRGYQIPVSRRLKKQVLGYLM